MKERVFAACFLAVPLLLWAAERPAGSETNWPQWRGPLLNGVAPTANPPVEWSESQNVRWKLAIPGAGHSTPIVWEDHVFVLTAIKTEKRGEPNPRAAEGSRRRSWMNPVTTENIHKFAILAINRRDGKIAWQRTSREEMPHEGTHGTGSWASNSPVTDGEHVYAYYGSRGLYCYDMQGNLKWEKDFGEMNVKLAFGEGSSPTLYGDKIIVTWDHEGQSFIVALDKKTGNQIWRVDREESTSWATPFVVEHAGKSQIITNATRRVRSYDLATGELLWESSGMTGNVIPTPVSGDGIVYVTSGFHGSALQAIHLPSAKGDLTDSKAILWTLDRDTPYTPSPLLYKGNLYLLKSNDAIFANFDAKTGEEHFSRQRLDGVEGVYASPVAAQDRVYVIGRNGTTAVLKHGTRFEVLATNILDDRFDASPAIAGDEIYLRGHKWLYCLARE